MRSSVFGSDCESIAKSFPVFRAVNSTVSASTLVDSYGISADKANRVLMLAYLHGSIAKTNHRGVYRVTDELDQRDHRKVVSASAEHIVNYVKGKMKCMSD